MNNQVKSNVQVKRGEIWFVDFGVGNGRVQGSKRPSIVISNQKCNDMSPVITVIALTSNVEKAMNKKLPTQVFVSKDCGLQSDSIALVEQPRSIDKSQLSFKVGEVDADTLILIEKALMIQVGINSNNICNNRVTSTNQIIKSNFDYDHAKELLVSISQLDKLQKEINKPIPAKKIILQEFISYCKSFQMDYKEIANQIRSKLSNKKEMALC